MKGVVGSFWFLTTFFGNILDVFFVGIKLWPTQAGEYIVLSIVMTGAALIFSMLAYFFYDYAEVRIYRKLQPIPTKKYLEDQFLTTNYPVVGINFRPKFNPESNEYRHFILLY